MNFNVFSWAIENLLSLIPLRVVESGEQGVRKVLGVATKTLDPGGPYLHIRGLFEVEVFNTAEQGVNLATQTVTTADEVEVTISVNVQYAIVEAHEMVRNVQDLDETLGFRAMTALSRKVRRTTRDELLNNVRAVETSVKRSLQAWADGVGVDVLDVGITDVARAKAFRLFGDPPATTGV